MQTRGDRMEGTDESTELPLKNQTLGVKDLFFCKIYLLITKHNITDNIYIRL